MANIGSHIFAYIVSQVETPLVSAVTQVMNTFLAFMAAPLKVGLVLYVALTGILIIRGECNEPGPLLIGRFLKMGLVVWVLTGTGIYQQYINDFFFTILPNDLSQALTSTGPVIFNANSFDLLWMKAWRGGLEVLRTLSHWDIVEMIIVVVFWIAAIVSIVFTFAIWLVSRIILALFIAIGPLLIVLALFPATRSIFERWIGSLISCVILQITTIVLLYIVLSAEQSVVEEIVVLGSADPMAMIQVLLAGVIFFAVAAFVALQLPGLASALAGGLNFHTGTVGRGIRHAIGSIGRSQKDGNGDTSRVGRTGALGLGHFGLSQTGRGGRAIYQRIRPRTGGSLSDGTGTR